MVSILWLFAEFLQKNSDGANILVLFLLKLCFFQETRH
jgi:hypothetical protein